MNLGRHLILHLTMHLRFHFKKHKKCKNCEENDAFEVAVYGSVDDATRGTPWNLKFGSLHVLYILYSAEQTKLLTFSN